MGRRPLIWTLFIIAWTIALLVPVPWSHESFLGTLWLPLAAKTLHLSMYALLACLTGWLRVPSRYRLLLLFVIMAHGAATEFLQDWVPSRSGTARDVCIDHIGILLGLCLSWKWWTEPDVLPEGFYSFDEPRRVRTERVRDVV